MAVLWTSSSVLRGPRRRNRNVFRGKPWEPRFQDFFWTGPVREDRHAPQQLDLLQRYQRQRKGENLLMMSAMEGFKRLFEQEALPLRWLRNAGLHTVDQLRPVKRELMRRAMGVA